MNIIKKIFSLALASSMCACALAACGTPSEESSVEESTESSEEISEVSVVPEAPEYWGFNAYERTENVGAPEEIESYKMTFEKVNDALYRITSQTDVGLLTLTFTQKTWGTYNLAAWTLTENNGKTHNFISGGTDWEYVYRAGKTSSSWVWSGGNHGNEVLKSLEFYNGETDEKIEISNGGKLELNKLIIIEKTNLLFAPDTDGDGYGYKTQADSYTEEDIYAEVARKYTVTGPQIKLNVDYKYIKDCYHWTSYTCMYPINKQYGLYCDMLKADGSKIKTIETLKVGKADYSGPMNNGNAATRATMYGYTDDRFSFDVWVNTVADSLDNHKDEFKAAFWDMNTTTNKLYFAKYSMNKATKVSADTEFHTECIWLFEYNK